MSHAVEFVGVSRVYAQGATPVYALRAVNLTIPKGQFIAVTGASGSGKSTLLHLMAALATPSEGQVRIFGQDISRMKDNDLTRFRRRNIGMIFQNFNLLPTMSALENAALPLMVERASLREAGAKAEALLKQVGLGERLGHRPDQLSGGQQQRVAIARALITDAPLLLADEPTGNLDSKTGEDILYLLRSLVEEQGRTLVMVTHDPRAAAYADRIITLSDGQIVEQIGSYNALLQPA